MNTTLMIYVVIGVLTVVPLLLYNIRKIWVKNPPEPVRFRPARCVVIVLIAAFIVTFLTCAYQATLRNRYEISLQNLATQHARLLTGQQSETEFRRFIEENGTDAVSASLEQADLMAVGTADTVEFQLSSACRPQIWQGKEGFEQAEVESSDNPLYLMYRLKAGEKQAFYALRLRQTGDGWKYDWFGEANEQQQKTIEMPTELNGKWYTVN